jgi:hypothetical protein
MNPEKREIGLRRRAGSIIAAASLILAGLWFFFLWNGRLGVVGGQAGEHLQVQSGSFADGGMIPRQFTCDGADASPALAWKNVPARTKSFALVMNDPDAPIDFTHWVAYNISPGASELAEGASGNGAMPPGTAEGTNSFGSQGYGGPCPPPGRPHHYVFRLYALDGQVSLPSGATRDQLESAIRRHILAEGQIVGLYRRAAD